MRTLTERLVDLAQHDGVTMNAAQKRKAMKQANEGLYALTHNAYTPFLPITDVDSILTAAGFNSTEPAIWCGHEGRSHEAVGFGVWLTLTWYKMPETGNYEVVAYVS